MEHGDHGQLCGGTGALDLEEGELVQEFASQDRLWGGLVVLLLELEGTDSVLMGSAGHPRVCGHKKVGVLNHEGLCQQVQFEAQHRRCGSHRVPHWSDIRVLLAQ